MPAYNVELIEALKQLSADDPVLQQGLMAGAGLSGLGSPTMDASSGFYNFGSLGRVEDKLDQPMADLLNRLNVESYTAAQRSPEATSALNALKKQTTNAGPSGNTAYALNSRRAEADAGRGGARLAPELEDSLSMARSRLGGFTAQEQTALRESQEAGLDSALQTGLRAAQVAGGGRNTGANLSTALSEFARTRRDLERDNSVLNINEANRRFNEYTGLATQTDQARRQERERQLAGLEGLSTQVDQDTFGRQTSANQGYNTAVGQREQFEQGNKNQALGNYTNTLFGARQDLLGRELFNLGQLEKEKQGQQNLLFGTAGLATSSAGQKESLEIARQQVENAKNAMIPSAVPQFSFDFSGGSSSNDTFGVPGTSIGTTTKPLVNPLWK